ncbi:MAG TPA: type II toxin-antitoxin system RelE/ParE family toxin [Thermoanaerobaculia bacterium]|jgi:mRNA interferase RelE/StbE|nr:type II toxin-antitoxin system RelE/ParE family toxin [Thermoanaerobaculia bacterium]
MDSYKLCLKPAAEKDLRKLPKAIVQRVLHLLDELPADPFPHQHSKLSGTERLYRIRLGDYRIVYEVDEEALEITVHSIRQRQDAYRHV